MATEGFATTHAVGTEGKQFSGDPAGNLLRKRPDIVAGGNEQPLFAGKRFFHVALSRLAGGMEHVPALTTVAITPQLRVAGDAPDVAADAVLLGEQICG